MSDLRDLKPIGMMYQTGYLTLTGYNPATKMYSLGIPDEEIRQDLSNLFAAVRAERTFSS